MKKPLGRGLDSLIPRSSEEAQAKHTGVVTSNYFELAVTEIIPNDNQPRRIFDEALLEELAESIRLKGVIQPIIVTKLNNGKYMIIEGERRWRASGIAGKKTIPVVVRNTETAKERLELALITNAQREDLNPVELAVAYKKLMDEHNYKHEDLGVIVGKSRSAVSTIETSTSNAEKILAHSIPIAPEPIIKILFGKVVKFKTSSELNTNSWSKLKFGKSFGLEPVADMIFLHS